MSTSFRLLDGAINHVIYYSSWRTLPGGPKLEAVSVEGLAAF